VDERNLLKTESEIVCVVFFGDVSVLREGFVPALHAMGIGASIADAVAPDPSEQGDSSCANSF
jgi:hypothetical protein